MNSSEVLDSFNSNTSSFEVASPQLSYFPIFCFASYVLLLLQILATASRFRKLFLELSVLRRATIILFVVTSVKIVIVLVKLLDKNCHTLVEIFEVIFQRTSSILNVLLFWIIVKRFEWICIERNARAQQLKLNSGFIYFSLYFLLVVSVRVTISFDSQLTFLDLVLRTITILASACVITKFVFVAFNIIKRKT